MSHLIVAGRIVDVDFPVVDGRLGGMWWDPGSPGTRKRKAPPTQVVWHHTAGEGSALGVYRTLHGGRKDDEGQPIQLSVHFVIDAHSVVQMADPLPTVCFHASTANDGSVGVEVINRGVVPALPKFPREAYVDVCNKRTLHYLAFSPEQVSLAKKLMLALKTHCGITLNWPLEKDGKTVLRSTFPCKAWAGQLGHLHVTTAKIDPSPHLMDELWRTAIANGSPGTVVLR